MHLNLKRLAIGVVLFVAIGGQPNGIFLLVPGYTALATLTLVLFVGYMIWRQLTRHRFSLPNINLLLPGMLFLLWAGISVLYAPNQAYAFRVWISMLFKFALFLALLNMVKETRDLKLMLGLISWVGVGFAVQALMLFVAILWRGLLPVGVIGEAAITGDLVYDFRINTYGWLGFAMSYINLAGASAPRVQAMFLEPGWFANFLELSIFATWGYRQLLSPRYRWLNTAMLIVQGTALLLTVSFAGWLAASLGLLTLLIVRFMRWPIQLGWRLFRFGIVGITLVALVSITLPEFSNAIGQHVLIKLNPNLQGTESSASQRIDDIQIVTRFFWERPIAGWGVNQVKVINQGRGANNTFVTVATELGIVGLVLYCWMLLAILTTIMSNVRLAYSTRSLRVVEVTAATSGAITALFVHTMAVESSWTFFYWIGLTLVYATTSFAQRALPTANLSAQEYPFTRQLVPQLNKV